MKTHFSKTSFNENQLSFDYLKKDVCKWIQRTLFSFVFIILFFNINAQWNKIGIDLDGDANFANFGISSAISSNGEIIAYGTPYHDAGGTGRGRVKVYKLINGNWVQLGGNIDGQNDIDNYGKSIALSSDGLRIAIGGPFCGAIDNRRGRVQVYDYINGTWVQVGGNINGLGGFHYFGESVALSSDGNTLVVGSPQWGTGPGNIRIFKLINGNWFQEGLTLFGVNYGENFGYDVAISSDGTIVSGSAPYYNHPDTTNKGEVRVFQNTGGSWSQLGSGIEGQGQADICGWAIDLSANGLTLAVGAPQNSGFKGRVRVFEYQSGAWTQKGYNINGEDLSDKSGWAVSLSADGNRVAIGAPANAGGSYQAGHVRVYAFDNGNWNQVDSDIDGEALGDASGYSLELSSDGATVVIGAPENDAGGFNKGHMRVYNKPVCVAPEFTSCPIDITVSTNSNTCSYLSNYTCSASGNPSPVFSYVFTGATNQSGNGKGSGQLLNLGTTHIDIAATNSCGEVHCQFNITVLDQTKPELSCPPAITLTTPPGICEIDESEVDLGTAVANDNCGILSFGHNAPQTYAVGLVNVKWTAKDFSLNKSNCIQKVTINADHCGVPEQVFHHSITHQSVVLEWNPGLCSNSYQTRYRYEISSGNWSSWTSWSALNNTTRPLVNLYASTFYNYQVRAKCGPTQYSDAVNGWFTTQSQNFSGFTTRSADRFIHPLMEGKFNPIHVFPNPADRWINVSWTEGESAFKKIEIMDIYGDIRYEQTLASDAKELKIELCDLNLHPGVYILRLCSDVKSVETKIVLSK